MAKALAPVVGRNGSSKFGYVKIGVEVSAVFSSSPISVKRSDKFSVKFKRGVVLK